MDKLIYLDNNSTTRIDDRVIDAMLPFLHEWYGNASSGHFFGTYIKKHVESSRENVANLLCCSNEKDIVFTSGATEAVNLALKGIAFNSVSNRKKIITITTEHMATLRTCRFLESIGFEIVYLPVQPNGLIDLDILKESIDEKTLIVAAMLANNETGIIHPIRQIAEIAKSKGAYMFCDATQAAGKIDVNVRDLETDMLCISGHKFHGPKGIGALYIKNNSPKPIPIVPLLHGGDQEYGLRGGTLNVPGIIGLGKASEIASTEMKNNTPNICMMRDLLETELLKIPNTRLNGGKENRISNTTNICFEGQDANIIIGKLQSIAVSNGSACNSQIFEPSHVLKAMGMDDNEALGSIRFSLSKYNTMTEIKVAIQKMREIIK